MEKLTTDVGAGTLAATIEQIYDKVEPGGHEGARYALVCGMGSLAGFQPARDPSDQVDYQDQCCGRSHFHSAGRARRWRE